MFNKIQTGTYPIHYTVLCVYKLPSKTYDITITKLKPSAFMALQSELILVLSTYSAWGLFTTCSVVVCRVPINVLQTTTKSKQNQTHHARLHNKHTVLPAHLYWLFLLGYSTKVLFTALTTLPEPPKCIYIKSLIAANCWAASLIIIWTSPLHPVLWSTELT